jgi:hypothetical protein
MVNQMNNTKAKSTPTITGERRAMVPHGLRIDEDEAAILAKAAKRFNTTNAALLRTAWTEYIDNHNLRG